MTSERLARGTGTPTASSPSGAGSTAGSVGGGSQSGTGSEGFYSDSEESGYTGEAASEAAAKSREQAASQVNSGTNDFFSPNPTETD